MSYYYQSFGLRLRSEFPIYQLMEVDSDFTPDVVIELGNVSDQDIFGLDFKVIKEEINYYLFAVKGFAIFEVEHWNKVKVQPLCPNAKDWQIFLLGNVIGRILKERELICLQGGSFIYNNKAFLILGPPGVGKSSALAGLMLKGLPIIADHFSCLSKRSNHWCIKLSHQRLKLWKDTIEKYSIEEKGLEKVRDKLDKFYLNQPAVENQEFDLGGFIFLNIAPGMNENFKTIQNNNIEILQLLIRTLYFSSSTNKVKTSENYFKALTELSTLSGISINRPTAFTDPRELSGYILNNLSI